MLPKNPGQIKNEVFLPIKTASKIYLYQNLKTKGLQIPKPTV